MKLICKQSKFETSQKIGLGPFRRTETIVKELPLTVGKEYLVQIVYRIDKRPFLPSVSRVNSYIPEMPVLVVFADNKEWIEVSYEGILPDNYGLNSLISAVFEEPK